MDEDKGEIALRRIEQVKKEIDHKLENFAKETGSHLRDFLERLHFATMESLAADRNSSATRRFLYKKGIMKGQEFVDFIDADPLANTYNKEIKIVEELLEDSRNLDPLNPREVDLLIEKNKVRSLELLQVRIDRLAIIIADLELVKGQEQKVNTLKKILQKMKEDIRKLFDETRKRPELPNREYYLKKEEAANHLDELFKTEKEQYVERLRQLPPLDIETHLEIYIKNLLVESKKLYCFGCFNSCIINCCVILEALLKDVIRDKEKVSEVDVEFDELVRHCRSKEYIEENEKKWLLDVKETYRNPYVHAHLEKIIPGAVVPGVQMEMRTGTISDLKMISTTDIPFLRQELKSRVDPERALHLFKETFKLVKIISKRHFDYTPTESEDNKEVSQKSA
jgi:hypothetical protein